MILHKKHADRIIKEIIKPAAEDAASKGASKASILYADLRYGDDVRDDIMSTDAFRILLEPKLNAEGLGVKYDIYTLVVSW